MYLTGKEILAQHVALKKTVGYFQENKEKIQEFFQRYLNRKIVFMGCGSSFMLAKSAQSIFAGSTAGGSNAITGGEYLVCPQGYQDQLNDSILVILSRSGLTTEIVRAAQMIRETTNAVLVSLTMKEENDLLPICELNLAMPWAYDESVCQTRTVSNLYTAVLLLEAYRSENYNLETSVKEVVDRHERFQEENRLRLEALGRLDFDRAIILADGPVSGIAEEGALAFTEIAMLPGASFRVLDYRHGPMVLHGEKTMTIVAVRPAENQYQQDMLKDLQKTGCILVTLSEEKEFIGDGIVDFKVKEVSDPAAYGIYLIYIAQMIAYTKALQRGVNPDQPKGLDAYITLS